MNVKKLLLALMITAILCFGTVVVQDFGYAQVNAEGIALYEQPWQRAPVLAQADAGDFVKMHKKWGNWFYAETTDQRQGWIRQDSLYQRDDVSSLVATLTAPEDGVLYPQPDAESAPLGVLPPDAAVQVTRSQNGWSRVAYGEADGYVPDAILAMAQPDMQPAQSRLTGDLLPYVPPRVIDPNRPMVALTFDDGPSTVTLDVLKVLEEYDVRGTFFMIGNRVGRYLETVRKVAQEGHEIGLHTWNHREMHRQSRAEIEQTLQRNIDAVQTIAGVTPQVLRPPYGTVTPTVRRVCSNMELTIAHWSVDTEDWRNRNTQKIADKILRGTSDGGIVLMHDLYDQTAAAVRIIVPELIERGYQLVTVSELLALREDGGVAGTVYRKCQTAETARNSSDIPNL